MKNNRIGPPNNPQDRIRNKARKAHRSIRRDRLRSACAGVAKASLTLATRFETLTLATRFETPHSKLELSVSGSSRPSRLMLGRLENSREE